MKKLGVLFIIMALFLATPNKASAQSEEFNPRMVIRTNPLSALGGPFWVVIIPVTGEYKVFYEIKTTKKQAASIGLSYLGPSLLLNLDELTVDGAGISGLNTSGFRVQGIYKFYLSRDREAPAGFYVGPHFSYATATLESRDNPDDNVVATKLNYSGVLGYQVISSGGFALDFFTGFGFRDVMWSVNETSGDIFDFNADRASVTVVGGISLGYAF